MLYTIEYTVTAIVCLITAIVIQRIYLKEKKRSGTSRSINGIMWFGLAIFIWGAGALLNLILVSGFGLGTNSKLLIYTGVLISLSNSLFILLSLPSIEHQSKNSIVVRMLQRFTQKEFFLLFGGILAMIAFVFIATSYNNKELSNSLIWLIDIPISIVVAISLLIELNKAFANRQMRFMYLPSFALFVLIVIAVTHRIIPKEGALKIIDEQSWSLLGTITAISFKFLFVLLFSILLYSWKFLSEKEQQQTLTEKLLIDKKYLIKEKENLMVANESHLDTIKSLKKELKLLKEITKVELSDRQKEVLANLGVCGNEKSYTEIAEAMNISVDGFQTHIYQIKKILNISGSAGKEQLIVFARENDLIRYATITT